jgi:hypothetical protein
MARKITISDGGGLSGFGHFTVYEDTAEVLLDALGEVLGRPVDWDNAVHRPRGYAQHGTVIVSAKEV